MKTLLYTVINIAVIKAITFQTSAPSKLLDECNWGAGLAGDAATRNNFVTNHGCWCQGYKEGDTEKPNLGKPVTELDRLCQTYHRCLHCVTNNAMCDNVDFSSYDATVGASNNCTQVTCSTTDKCKEHVCECTSALATGIEELPVTVFGDNQYQGYGNCDRSSRPTTGQVNECPSFGPTPRAQCAGLTDGFLVGRGVDDPIVHSGLTSTEFNTLLRSLTVPFYIRRVRKVYGKTEFKDTIYKRHTTIPADMDMYKLFTNFWKNQVYVKNEFKVDFDIFDNMVDAVAQQDAWQFCNFNAAGVGYPRDCGKTTASTLQWNSITRSTGNANRDWNFYIADC